MVTKVTHINGGVLYLMLADVPGYVGVRVGSHLEPRIIVAAALFCNCCAGATYFSLGM